MVVQDKASQELAGYADALVMLTWSNWHTEPRSNRYHYATRFARHIPVILVQPDLEDDTYHFEETGIENLTVLHLYRDYNSPKQLQIFNKALLERKCIHPIFWVYNTHLRRLL